VQILPELPTTSEQGLAGLQLAIWHGLYAPRGTPAPVIAALARALQESVASPAFVAAMSQVGVVPVTAEQATPKQLRQTLASQTAKWRPLIVKSGQFAD
jgi:tripartite-type tricarboxylate transporter receptor subunit TctC